MTANPMLRPILRFDAATCAAMGLLLAIGADAIARITALPVPLLREAGLLLLPFAAFVLWAAGRSGWPAQAVVAANIAWIAGSVALIASPWSGNAFGIAFLGAQAAVVMLLAVLEWRHLARVPATA
ncbi:MAG: hypothetical protein J7500_01465 [Sphingomonas sp.]|uniref:hypothetical protein n=1 Tax=Sphingomonas sp. TaxID=28214 RepID=UPI001B0A7F8C|nr:hypothetical protein [Sphingomonas sp.]MBO9621357.1 hypothetical protein [Sphingomonas sp.]